MTIHRGAIASPRERVPARAASIAALAVTIAMVGALPAASHTALLSATPEEGSTVDAPAQVALVFNEELIDVGGAMTITDADGRATELTVSYPQPDTASASLPALPAGPASVSWRVVSADGHPVEGTLSFVVAAAPQPSVTPEPEPSDAAPSVSASASPSVSVTPIAAQPEPSGGIPIWLWVALVASVVAAGAVAMVTAKRR